MCNQPYIRMLLFPLSLLYCFFRCDSKRHDLHVDLYMCFTWISHVHATIMGLYNSMKAFKSLNHFVVLISRFNSFSLYAIEQRVRNIDRLVHTFEYGFYVSFTLRKQTLFRGVHSFYNIPSFSPCVCHVALSVVRFV